MTCLHINVPPCIARSPLVPKLFLNLCRSAIEWMRMQVGPQTNAKTITAIAGENAELVCSDKRNQHDV